MTSDVACDHYAALACGVCGVGESSRNSPWNSVDCAIDAMPKTATTSPLPRSCHATPMTMAMAQMFFSTSKRPQTSAAQQSTALGKPSETEQFLMFGQIRIWPDRRLVFSISALADPDVEKNCITWGETSPCWARKKIVGHLPVGPCKVACALKVVWCHPTQNTSTVAHPLT